jgi:hypothetical protein
MRKGKIPAKKICFIATPKMGNLPQLRGKLPNELGQVGIAFLHSIWDMLHTHKMFSQNPRTHKPTF